MDDNNFLDAIDIVELASKYTDLEEKGGEWWGISPITYPPENTPSFSCRRETGKFYDFSSGVGGSAITLIQYCEKVSKSEAIEILQKYAGIDAEEFQARPKLTATIACKRFQKPKTTQKASKVTVLPNDYMLRYEKRADKLAVWEHEGISKETLDKFQVYYDSFSDRLVYPIRNINGEIVNVGGRTLDPLWKDKNLRKYCYFFSWGRINTLYGISENLESIKNQHEVIVFEGCKSVLIADSWGITNTAAILTSHLSDSQMKILAQLGCRVVFALDKDIRVSLDKRIEKLKNYVPVEYIWDYEDLLGNKDSPVDRGKEVFMKLYGQRIKR